MESISAIFANAGVNTEPGSPLIDNGYVGNDQPTAPNMNFYLNLACQVAKEALNKITSAGFTPDGSDFYQLQKADKALSLPIGADISSDIALTPVIYSAARSTANPTNPLYNPIIARYDADHDVTSAMAPDLVTAYRAEIATLNCSGTRYSSFTGTVSGSTITFASNTQNIAFVSMYANEAAANGYIQAESASPTPLFTGTAQRCIRVNGTDYAVTNASTGALTITVTGTPTTGSQTCQAPTYCIAGSTSVRLPRISGFVGVVTQDYDGEFVAGWRKMDRGQGHNHYLQTYDGFSTTSAGGYIGGYNTAGTGGGANKGAVLLINTDGLNGTPRTGKTGDPKAYSKYLYTHAGRLLVAVA